jgi:hypothetical protein
MSYTRVVCRLRRSRVSRREDSVYREIKGMHGIEGRSHTPCGLSIDISKREENVGTVHVTEGMS